MVTGRYAGEIGYTNNSTKPDTLRVLPAARESSVGNFFRNAGYQTVYSGYPGFYCGRTHMEEYGFTQNGTDYYEVLPILPRTFLLAIIRLRMNLFPISLFHESS